MLLKLLFIVSVLAGRHAAAASTHLPLISGSTKAADATTSSSVIYNRGTGFHPPVQYVRVVQPSSAVIMQPTAVVHQPVAMQQAAEGTVMLVPSGSGMRPTQQQQQQQQMQQQTQQPGVLQGGAGDESGPRTPPSSSSSSTVGDADAAAAAANSAQAGMDPFSGAALLGQQQQQQPLPGRGRSPEQKFPFKQCANATLTFDVSFVGPVQYVQVGTVRYAYHKFGPLSEDTIDSSTPRLGFSKNLKEKLAPVVFISGWGTSMYMWPIPLLKALAATRTVIIFDNMRTGRSTDTARTQLTVPMMADSVAGLIQQLRLDKPDIWSWSMGACIGYALLAKHSGKVGNVIIASGTPGGTSALMPPVIVWQEARASNQNYAELLPFLFPEGLDDTGICNFYAAFNSFSAAGLLTSPINRQALQEQGSAITAFFNDNSVVSRLKDVPNRVLILHGVQDRLMPIRNAVLGAQNLLGSWMLQFPGEGHGVPFDNQPAVIAMTQEFFSFASPLTSATLKKWSNYGETYAQQTRQRGMGRR